MVYGNSPGTAERWGNGRRNERSREATGTEVHDSRPTSHTFGVANGSGQGDNMKIRVSSWKMWIALGVLAISSASVTSAQNLPPAARLMEPGPGVGGPGPGVLPPVPALYSGGMMVGGGGLVGVGQTNAQVLFAKPESLQVRWDVTGYGQFDSTPLIVPGRHNFPQGAMYRLKVSNVPGREEMDLYPTLELAHTTPRTAAYLAHNAIPVQFTQEDFEQAAAGNFVTKVIYLPDPEFQRLALAGVETLVSTRLDPGLDPIVEADRRGAILAVVRVGNKDVELPGTTDGEMMYDGGGACPPFSGGGLSNGSLPGYVAGVSAPTWGMPYVGTPIGLPGPAHIPLGAPAGLHTHVMKNHTHMHIPDPVGKFVVHVKQQPGYQYPAPPTRAYIREQSFYPSTFNHMPHYMRSTEIPSGNGYGAGGDNCPPGTHE